MSNFTRNFVLKFCVLFVVLPVLWSVPFAYSHGASEEEETALKAREQILDARAGEDVMALVNAVVSFSARESAVSSESENDEVKFWWDFGDLTPPQEGESAEHRYVKPGDYTVTLTLKTRDRVDKDTMGVTITERALFLIRSQEQDPIAATNIENAAKREGFLLYTLLVDEKSNDLIIEDDLLTALGDRVGQIRSSSLIIGWTEKGSEINALLRFGKKVNDASLFQSKSIVIATGAINLISRRTQPLYDALQPKNAIVVTPDLIERVIEGESKGKLIEAIQGEGEGFVLLGIHSRRNFGNITFYNFLSHFTNFLVNRGVSINTILLILMLPIVATIISFARQVVGVRAFGIYIPTILTLTFVTIGISAGLLVMIQIVLVGTLLRVLLRRLRLLYLPRMALVITGVSISLLLLLYVSVNFPLLSLVSVSAFPLLILVILVEEFVKVQIKEGAHGALILTLETLLLSSGSYYIVNTNFVRQLVLSYPEIIIFTIVVNGILGKWRGLRLFEYYRFREVLRMLRFIEQKKKGGVL